MGDENGETVVQSDRIDEGTLKCNQTYYRFTAMIVTDVHKQGGSKTHMGFKW